MPSEFNGHPMIAPLELLRFDLNLWRPTTLRDGLLHQVSELSNELSNVGVTQQVDPSPNNDQHREPIV